MSRTNTPARATPRRRILTLLPLLGALALGVAGCGNLAGLNPPGQAPKAAAAAPTSPLQQANAARAAGDLARAADLYRSAHAADPKLLEPVMQLGATYVAMQAYPEALNTYREAAALAPKDPEIAWRMSQVLLVEDQPQAALATLQTVLPARRNDPRVYSALGVAYALMGQYDLAERNLTAGLRLAPDHIGLRDNLGLTQFLAGDYAAAVVTLNDIAALPQAARARQNLAMIYALHGDIERARVLARRDLDAASVDAALARYRALAAKGKADLAAQGAALFGAHFSGDPGGGVDARVAATPLAAPQWQ